MLRRRKSRGLPPFFLSSIIHTVVFCSQQQAEQSNTYNCIFSAEMATFEPISYAYVPTPPRSKSTTTRHKNRPKPFSILHKNQYIKPSSIALEKPRPLAEAAAAVDDIRDEQFEVRSMF
jgi:hypothetical protein